MNEVFPLKLSRQESEFSEVFAVLSLSELMIGGGMGWGNRGVIFYNISPSRALL